MIIQYNDWSETASETFPVLPRKEVSPLAASANFGFQCGLTLLELLIAIALFAAVGMIATLMLNQAINSSAALEDRNEKLTSLITGLTLFEQDLIQIHRRAYKTVDSSKQLVKTKPLLVVDNPDLKALQFMRAGNHLTAKTPLLIRYQFHENELVRGVNQTVDGFIASGWNDHALISDISDFSIQYFFNREWHDEFQSHTYGNLQIFPDAIRISMQHEQFGKISKTVLLPGERL